MKIHYNPFKTNDEESYEYGYCKTLLSDISDNSSTDKNDVTCKKCIKLFDNADKELARIREDELDYMQGFVDFMNNTKV